MERTYEDQQARWDFYDQANEYRLAELHADCDQYACDECQTEADDLADLEEDYL